MQFARNSIFGGSSFKLDYLTKPSFFEDFGFVSKVRMEDRVKPEDELFLVAYPYFNVNGNLRIIPSLPPSSIRKKQRKMSGTISSLLSIYCLTASNGIIQKCLWSKSFTKRLS